LDVNPERGFFLLTFGIMNYELKITNYVYFSLTKGMPGILAERNSLFARMGGIFITAGHRPAAEAPPVPA
jgi:hypothetical protein